MQSHVLTTFERIFIIMIEQTDASKSDERRVKNTSKPLTQKSKGETDTMGNRGIQLSVFFVISLMLIAAMFSVTAMAADGDGTVTVGWTPRLAATDVANVSFEDDDSEMENTTPLSANTGASVVKITYTLSAADDVDMSGGRVRVVLPDWKMGTFSDDADKEHFQYVQISSAGTILYKTRADSRIEPTVEAGQLSDKERLALVTSISKTKVEVMLHDDWERGARSLEIILGDLTTATPPRLSAEDGSTNKYPYFGYQLTTSSSAKNGTLVKLDGQPTVRVGNVTTTDAAAVKFEITPAAVYAGEKNREFAIKYKAPGPMYSSSADDIKTTIFIAIPTGMRPKGPESNIRVSGAGIDFTTAPEDPTAADDIVSITLDLGVVKSGGLVKDQTVTVRYTANIATTDDTTGFVINEETDISSSIGIGVQAVAVTAGGTGKTDGGGVVKPKAGSGKVEITPVAVRVGALRGDITVTYTAATDLLLHSSNDTMVGYDLEITPAGIIIDTTADSTEKLQDDTSNAYGYVTGSMSDDLEVMDSSIKWTNITLAKGKTVTAKIRRVNIIGEPGEYKWDAKIASSETELGAVNTVATLPTLSVVKTSDNPVKLEIEGSTTFRAGSKEDITFKFIADSTPIRGGSLTLYIPSALSESGPTKTDTADTPGRIVVSGAGVAKADYSTSDRNVNITVKKMNIGEAVKIEYTDARLSYTAGKVKVTGTFRASATTSTRPAGEKEITIGKINDGIGLTSKTRSPVELSPTSIQAGSRSGNTIKVDFTAAGTMDGGKVSLEIPDDWGPMQADSTKRNHISTRPVPGSAVIDKLDVEANGSRAVATIKKLGPGQSFSFIYGGGIAPTNNGVEVQDTVEVASFTIKSDGDGDDVFAVVESDLEHTGREAIINPKELGKIFKDAPGMVQIAVTSAQDGTGSVVVTDKDGNVPVIRAADDEVQLVFTYTPIQTIQDGELKFTVPGSWSSPQVGDSATAGYTEVTSDDGAGFGSASDETAGSIIVPIFSLDKDQTIKITYGALASGRAMASIATGTTSFKFAVKGHVDGNLDVIDVQPEVEVMGQASGKGKAVVTETGDTLYAGDADREIKVVYTAAGEMVAGKVQLTIPADWSPPTGNVTAMIDMAAVTPNFSGQVIVVDSVGLLKDGTVTFVYTGMVQPTKADGVKFAVKSHGGLISDTFKDVSGEGTILTVDVGEARNGSGMGVVEPKIVQAGATGVKLIFTYTAVGQIDPPREFRVRVPISWGEPSNAITSADNKGTYAIEHRSETGSLITASVEEIDPIGQYMAARVKIGGLEVEAGDQISFTYENADAPTTPEVSDFQILFNGVGIGANVQVRVQDSTPSALSLSSAGTVSAAADAMPLGITVGLQDDDGDAVAQNSDVMVTLVSTSAGTFSVGEMGTESITVTIAGGNVSTMVDYMDSTAGTAIITASAPNLDPASQEVTVTAAPTVPVDPPVDPPVEVVAITEGSIMVSPSLAMADGMVTVSAMGTAGQTATFSVGSIVTDGSMTGDGAGSYSGSFSVVVDQHADGMYGVSVTLNADATTTMMVADALTIDSTDPTVTVTAPESAANGDMVMISAMVTDAGMISSVSADVSMLDSTQTAPVALTMGEDGAYSATVTISDENENANGSKTVTVTAMDAAGNSGTGEATVMLANTLSYTSMIPAGLSLFHVPLDVEGLDTVGDLKGMIGNGSNLAVVYDHATSSWNSRSDDVMITADLGIVLHMASAAEYTFEGEAWGEAGTSMISLQAGLNLIGLPVNDPSVMNVSDIADQFDEGVVSAITISTDDGFELVSDTMDPAVMGDAAYRVTASAAGTATLLGDGWSNSGMAGAAPIALAGYSVEGQTPVLDVQGVVVDEITGLAREGFRVKVKNLSTKASLNRVTSLEVEAGGYNMTFVDLKSGNAARIGDVLEISADSPSPLIGVQPVRHVVTADDVKSSILDLEDLIAYEIPAETELLRNYPNPFNPETWIPYRLAEDADVSLTIYDVNGELVRSIDVGHQSAAVYESRAKAIYWDGRNRFGEQVASGIYFYSLSTGDFSATRKMVILK